MNRIKSLAMLKMEKNFIAHNEKGYQRMPYIDWPIFNDESPDKTLPGFVNREYKELIEALYNLWTWRRYWDGTDGYGPKLDFWRHSDYASIDRTRFMVDLKSVMLEIADVQNTLDYLFEALLNLYIEARP